jgi:hypothetical protein
MIATMALAKSKTTAIKRELIVPKRPPRPGFVLLCVMKLCFPRWRALGPLVLG